MTVDVDRDNTKRKSPKLTADPASVAVAIILLVLCCLFAWRPMVDHSDFWNHAAIGRWIWTHGRVPTHCLFLWTSHDPYVAHSWLSEILIYLLVRAAGETVGSVLAICIVAAISFGACLMLWQLCRVNRATASTAFLFFAIGVSCAGERFAARPEILSFLLFALLLRLLLCWDFLWDTGARNADAKLFATVIPLFILWTNLHGAVLSGLIALWIVAGVETVVAKASRRSRSLLLLAACCTAATVVNPYGFHYYSIYRMPGTQVFNNIAEWKPLFAAPAVPTAQIALRFLLVGASLVCWLRTPGRRWSHIALLVVFAVLAVAVRRNVIFLSLVGLSVAVPYFRAQSLQPTDASPNVSRKPSAANSRRRPPHARSSADRASVRPSPIITDLVCIVAAFVISIWTLWPTLKNGLPPPTMGLATDQALIVSKLGTDEHVLNFYDSGSYLEWRFAGEPALYIDSVNAYPDSVFDDYWDIRTASPRGIQLLDEQQIDCVMGEHIDSVHPVLTRDDEIYAALSTSPQWALLYYGPDGPVWIRREARWQQYWEGVPTFSGHSMDDFMRYFGTCARYSAPSEIPR
jgi:hypothetical protein